jgi:hypothetical protein
MMDNGKKSRTSNNFQPLGVDGEANHGGGRSDRLGGLDLSAAG